MKIKSLVYWILIILAGLLVAFVPLHLTAGAVTPVTRVIRVAASQYSYMPDEINVNKGDVVTIQFTSTDVVHGLYIDGYNLSVQADPGQTALLSFVADQPGAFHFRCNVTCGAMHPFMIGKLSVGPNEWLYRGSALALLVVLGTLPLMRYETHDT